MSETREALLRAGERLFARDGIHRARIKDLNELAGQRNVSALHYHFGSREGLLRAIVERHVSRVDSGRAKLLRQAPEKADVRELMRIVIAPLADELQTPSGRDYLRIVPQILESDVSPPALLQTMQRAEQHLQSLAERTRKERLSAMIRAMTALLEARASQLERGQQPYLDDREFVNNLVDMATGMLLAPTSISKSSR